MNKILDKKVAIVTGASNGIGLATVQAFLKAGASVLGVDMCPPPASVPLGNSFAFTQVDLTAPDAATSIIDAAQSSFSDLNRVDILINNAGIMDVNAGVATLSDDTWDKVIAVNLTAPVKFMREAVKVMKAQGGGSIVNVSSKAGSSGAGAGVAYTASKHGLIGATKNTAWLYKEDGVRCNAVAPGAVRTNIASSMDMTKIDVESYKRIKPILDVHVNSLTGEGIASPEVAANAILFLASDLSKGITGVIVPVDNGWSVI